MKGYHFFIFLAILPGCLKSLAQGGWELKKEKDGIRVYSRSNGHSKFNEVKVETVLKSRLSDLAALVLDIGNHPRWSYNSKKAYVLKQVSPAELFFYAEVNSPWPASNRDLVIHLQVTQDPHSKIMTIKGVSVPGMVAPKKDIVRVPFSKETWTVVPLDKTTIKIEYLLEIDPGESAPAWIINLFVTKAPLESFRNLTAEIQIPKYKQASLPFIRNF